MGFQSAAFQSEGAFGRFTNTNRWPLRNSWIELAREKFVEWTCSWETRGVNLLSFKKTQSELLPFEKLSNCWLLTKSQIQSKRLSFKKSANNQLQENCPKINKVNGIAFIVSWLPNENDLAKELFINFSSLLVESSFGVGRSRDKFTRFVCCFFFLGSVRTRLYTGIFGAHSSACALRFLMRFGWGPKIRIAFAVHVWKGGNECETREMKSPPRIWTHIEREENTGEWTSLWTSNVTQEHSFFFVVLKATTEKTTTTTSPRRSNVLSA